jgi:hypothetical protein
VHRCEREQRMFDAVAGQNHERTFRTQLPVQQCIREPPHLLIGRRVGQRAPLLVTVALSQKDIVRTRVRPVHEVFGESQRISAQRIERT